MSQHRDSNDFSVDLELKEPFTGSADLFMSTDILAYAA